MSLFLQLYNLHNTINSEQDLLFWNAVIRGPKETPYENFIFKLAIIIPLQYPMLPPSIKFITPIFHPNVNFQTGTIGPIVT